MNLRLFMPYPEQKARFESICFNEILLYAGTLENLCAKLRNNRNWCKILSRTPSRLNISYMYMYIECGSKRLVPKVFFFPVPGTLALVLNMDITESGLQITLYF